MKSHLAKFVFGTRNLRKKIEVDKERGTRRRRFRVSLVGDAEEERTEQKELIKLGILQLTPSIIVPSAFCP